MEVVPECYMKCSRIQRQFTCSPTLKVVNEKSHGVFASTAKTNYSSANVPSFQGTGAFIPKSKLALRRLFIYMKDVSEITNAFIAAIGTGIIAPAIIMVSPGKGDKEDQDKKFFQAIRQPLSAGLALAFQVPMTMLLNRGFDNLAYVKKASMFDDEVIGSLIPDKKYLKKGITKAEVQEMQAKFDDIIEGKSLRQELENKIREEYKDVGLDVSDEELAKRVKKDKDKFLRDKIVDEKHDNLLRAKVQELKDKHFVINDTDLVTDDYRSAVKEKLRYKDAYNEIAKKPELKLSWFDKTIKMMGFSNKRIKNLEEAQKAFTTEKGLELLREDKPKIFTDQMEKLKKFLENKNKEAQKTFQGKKYWFSLLVNLFMVTASCYALNWAHPRLKEQIDKYKNNNSNQQLSDDKKVEVK